MNILLLLVYFLYFYTIYAEEKLGKCTLTEPCRLDSVCKSVERVCADFARKEYCQAMCSNTTYSGSDPNIQCTSEKNGGLTLIDFCRNRNVCKFFCQEKSPGEITKLRSEKLQNGNCRIFWSPSNTSKGDVYQYFVIIREKKGEGRCLSMWRLSCRDCGSKIPSASPNEKCELKEAREFGKMDPELNWVIAVDRSVNVTVVACSKWGCGAPRSISITKLVPTPWWIIPISIVVGIILLVALVLFILWRSGIITMTNIRNQCNCYGSTPPDNPDVPQGKASSVETLVATIEQGDNSPSGPGNTAATEQGANQATPLLSEDSPDNSAVTPENTTRPNEKGLEDEAEAQL